MPNLYQTVKSAIQASDDFAWSDDWQEPTLDALPVVVARPMGAGPAGVQGVWREVLAVRCIFNPARKARSETDYVALTERHAALIDAIERAGCYPRIAASTIDYATVFGKREYVTVAVTVYG